MIPTDEQKAIFAFVESGKGDLIIEALAGTGKTFSLMQSLSVIPQRSVLMTAYNKRIADTLQAKLATLNIRKGSVVHVKTFHAQGLAILKHHFPHLMSAPVSGESSEALINEAGELPFKLRRIAVRLLRLVKETVAMPNHMQLANEIEGIGHEAAFFSTKDGTLRDQEIGKIVEVVFDAFRNGMDFTKRDSIDFCDMIWGPLVRKLAPPSRYQAVFVDEAQDLSTPQLDLVLSLVAPGGRLIGVGDKFQAIYKFRGADPDKVWSEFTRRGAVQLPLTTTFRCAKEIVEEANQIVPTLRAMGGAPDGAVHTIDRGEMVGQLRKRQCDTFILSRTNADLLDIALYLWRCSQQGQRMNFALNAGHEMLEPLFQILDLLKTTGSRDQYMSSLLLWFTSEMKRAEAAHATSWADRLEEQRAMLSIASAYVPPNRIKALLMDMLREEPGAVLLSSVHKVKGLEAERVFLLQWTFQRHQKRVDKEGEPLPLDEDEIFVEYVGITRAKLELNWVME